MVNIIHIQYILYYTPNLTIGRKFSEFSDFRCWQNLFTEQGVVIVQLLQQLYTNPRDSGFPPH